MHTVGYMLNTKTEIKVITLPLKSINSFGKSFQPVKNSPLKPVKNDRVELSGILYRIAKVGAQLLH